MGVGVEEEGPIFQAAQSLSAHQEGEDARSLLSMTARYVEENRGRERSPLQVEITNTLSIPPLSSRASLSLMSYLF